MPGALPHIFAGSIMYFIGRYYYKFFFESADKSKERIILFVSCLFFSTIPDFVLAFYYTTHTFPFDLMWPLHSLVHMILLFFAFFLLLFLTVNNKIKKKPIWIIGMWCIILHVIMDFFIPDSGIWF